MEEARQKKMLQSLAQLESLTRRIPINDDARIKETINKCGLAYVSLNVRAKYPLVSPGIFKIERAITFEHEGKEKKIEVPVFAHAYIADECWKREYEIKPDNRYDEALEVTVRAEKPYIPQEIRTAGEEALAFCYDFISRAFRTPVLGDLLLSGGVDLRTPQLRVLWKPKPEDFSIEVKVVPDPDPILLLTFGGQYYKVAAWEDDHEERFEGLLDYFMDSTKF